MVSTQSVSVDLPEDLYERIREIAERNERSVEAVLRESLEVMFGSESEEPTNQTDHYTLLRSQALHLLKLRGHDIDRYLKLGA